MQSIGREEPRVLLETGTAPLVEALPEPRYAAEHLPGAVNFHEGGKTDRARAGLPFQSASAAPEVAR